MSEMMKRQQRNTNSDASSPSLLSLKRIWDLHNLSHLYLLDHKLRLSDRDHPQGLGALHQQRYRRYLSDNRSRIQLLVQPLLRRRQHCLPHLSLELRHSQCHRHYLPRQYPPLSAPQQCRSILRSLPAS